MPKFQHVSDHDAYSLRGIGIEDAHLPTDNYILVYNSGTSEFIYKDKDKFGTDTSFSEFEPDGTLIFSGDATVYRDFIMSVQNLRPGISPPTFDTFQDGIYGIRFNDSVNDEVHGSVEFQHDYVEGSDFEVHVHWSPTTTDVGNCRFGFEYSIANRNTGTFGASTTIFINPTATGIINNHIYSSFGLISGVGLTIGAHIVFRFFREGDNVLDTFTGNAFVHTIGIHYKCDTVGSRQPTIK